MVFFSDQLSSKTSIGAILRNEDNGLRPVNIVILYVNIDLRTR